MSCINFLGNPFLHDNHGLVVRILASGAGGLDLTPGGVTCGIDEEMTLEIMGHAWCDKTV
jgi:hypothetical protein